ncbi:phosphate/phosphite/phosphonate ABC transporter substrate-binding protein [Terasakiella sp. SH-1]|uniref:phosphate/phosphite/phosphonate ABC transporter substrate-binding protein n=1 Tax=Terasakiella sp. SH-1 TaxID=2560057 RepID=UPI00142FF36C|nr:phosphate/phosphite/phosphonate ABC transporter substrate-binding protein [Terasakiella sp. SH-1]
MLRFGLQGSANEKTLVEIWSPVLTDLSEYLGVRVVPVTMHDYKSVIWFLENEAVDFAWTGNKLAIEAVDETESEIFLQVLNQQGEPGYKSVLITLKDKPLSSLRQVMGFARQLKIAFGNKKSTSGTLVPAYYIQAQTGKKLDRFLSIQHSANHEQSFKSVVFGDVDVATISSIAFQRFQERFPHEAALVKVIWESPMIPSDAIIRRKTIKQVYKDKVEEFLLSYGVKVSGKSDERVLAERKRLAQLKWSGFKLSNNQQLIPIRELMEYKKQQ